MNYLHDAGLIALGAALGAIGIYLTAVRRWEDIAAQWERIANGSNEKPPRHLHALPRPKDQP